MKIDIKLLKEALRFKDGITPVASEQIDRFIASVPKTFINSRAAAGSAEELQQVDELRTRMVLCDRELSRLRVCLGQCHKKNTSKLTKEMFENKILRKQIERLGALGVLSILSQKIKPWERTNSQEIMRRRAEAQDIIGFLSAQMSPKETKRVVDFVDSVFSISAPILEGDVASVLRTKYTKVGTPSSTDKAKILFDMLSSKDERYSSVLTGLMDSHNIVDLEPIIHDRTPPLHLEAQQQHVDNKKADDNAAGLRFDMVTGAWVQEDRSWSYEVPFGQLFEYDVQGVIDGKEDFIETLKGHLTNPLTGDCLLSDGALSELLNKLSSPTDDEPFASIRQRPITICFSTTEGGDVPVAAQWEIPLPLWADVMDAFVQSIDIETAVLPDEPILPEGFAEPFEVLRQKYDGTPNFHRRAHAALINIGKRLHGTFYDLGRDGGQLPKSKTRLTNARLQGELKDIAKTKYRFTVTDYGEVFILSDAEFMDFRKKYKFLPNHELIAYNRPILSSGYLFVEAGQVVGFEDDNVMLPGKLGDNLPPAMDILECHGIAMDKDKIEEGLKAISWEAYDELESDMTLPSLDTHEPEEIKERLLDSDHQKRPFVLAAWVKQLFSEATGSRSEREAYCVEVLQAHLSDFRIFDVSIKHFRKNELPRSLELEVDLMIDERVAPSLVRKIVSGLFEEAEGTK